MKIKAQQKTIHKKGKSGKSITNYPKKIDLKRKRDNLERIAAENRLRDDKVFLPPENDDEEVTVPLGKE